MFGFFKKNLSSNQAINPISHAQRNLNEMAQLNKQRQQTLRNNTGGLDDRTKQMLDRMNRLNRMNDR